MRLPRTLVIVSVLIAGLLAPFDSFGQKLPEGLRRDPLLILLFDKWPEILTHGPQGLPLKHLEKKNMEIEERNARTMEQLASYPFPFAVATFADYTRGTNLPDFRFVLISPVFEAFNDGWYSKNLVGDVFIYDVDEKRRRVVKWESGGLNYGGVLRYIATELKD